MKIGIDLDECLAEFFFSFCNYYNNKYKTNFEFKDFKDSDLWKTIGVNRESAIKEVYSFYDTSYYENLPVVFFSRTCVNELRRNNDLFVITSRQNDFIEKTNYWINQNFPNKFSDVIFTGEWNKGSNAVKKSEICDKLEIELFIEDNLDNALDCRKDKRKIFLLDKPWNQNKKLNGVKRVYNWHEILEDYHELNR